MPISRHGHFYFDQHNYPWLCWATFHTCQVPANENHQEPSSAAMQHCYHLLHLHLQNNCRHRVPLENSWHPQSQSKTHLRENSSMCHPAVHHQSVEDQDSGSSHRQGKSWRESMYLVTEKKNYRETIIKDSPSLFPFIVRSFLTLCDASTCIIALPFCPTNM